MATQAQKSLTTMLVVLIGAAGIGAYAYFGVYKTEQAETKKNDETARTFTFDKAKAKQLSLTAKGVTIEAEKVGDDWRIKSPVDARADKAALNAIIDKLWDLKAKDLNEKSKGKLPPDYLVTDDAKKLTDYGLEKPTLAVKVVFEGAPGIGLQIGTDNTFDKSIYFKRDSDTKIYMGDSAIKTPLDKTLFDLRDKAIVVQDDKDIQSIAVEGNGQAWSAEREGEGWKLTAPIPDKGDKTVIEGVLNRIRSVRAKSFPAEKLDPKDAEKYGLDKPAVSVILTVGADKAMKTLALGQVGAEKDQKTYAHIGDGPVAEIENTFVKDMLKSAMDLRDKTVVAMDREKIEKIEVLPSEGEKFTVLRSKETKEGATLPTDAFQLEGKSEKLKAWKMSSALFSLSNMRGQTIVEENTSDLAKYALDKPQFTYVVTGDGGKELGRILIGALNDTRYYVKSASSPRVYDVEKAVINELPKTADELIDDGSKDAGPVARTMPAPPGGPTPANAPKLDFHKGLPPGVKPPQ